MADSAHIISLFLCSLVLAAFTAEGFLHNSHNRCSSEDIAQQADFTHISITEAAIQKVVTELNGESCKSGANCRDVFPRKVALDAVLDASVAVDRISAHIAVNHFNGEQLVEGNEKLRDLRSLFLSVAALNSTHKVDVIRSIIGRSLHLIQDFYSNTDWVETQNSDAQDPTHYFDQLGFLWEDDGKFPLIYPNYHKMCSDVPRGSTSSGISHHRDILTSGYRSGQDIVKPTEVNVGVVTLGKCSHGGQEDLSALVVPRGGINKESRDPQLSPRHNSHEIASLSAIAASKAFLYSGTGIFSDAGSFSQDIDLLKEVTGITDSPTVSLLYTQQLQDVSFSTEWKLMISTEMAWPWKRNHLYTGAGDRESDSIRLYSALELTQHQIESVTARKIIHASLALPEHSTLIIITDAAEPVVGLWEEDLVKKSLIVRNIRLIVLAKYSIPFSSEQESNSLRNTCLSTNGQFYLVSDEAEMVNVLAAIQPLGNLTRYESGLPDVMLPLLSKESAAIEVNCYSMQKVYDSEIQANGTIQSRIVPLTLTTSVYSITSQESDTVQIRITVPNSDCQVSVIGQQLMEISVMTKAAYDQLLPTKLRVSGNSQVVAQPLYPEITPLSVSVRGHDKHFTECRSTGEGQRFITNRIPHSQPDYFTVKYSMGDYEYAIREYINTVHVDVQVPPVTDDVINVKIICIGRPITLELIQLIGPSDVIATVGEFTPVDLEDQSDITVQTTVTSAVFLGLDIRTLLLEVHGRYRETGVTFVDVAPVTFVIDGSTMTLPTTPPKPTTPKLTTTTATTTTTTRTTTTATTTTEQPHISPSSTEKTNAPAQIHSSSTVNIPITTIARKPSDDEFPHTPTKKKPFHITTLGTVIITKQRESSITRTSNNGGKIFTLSVVGTILAATTPMMIIVTILVVRKYILMSRHDEKRHIPVTTL